jgi:hypothetical protein
MSDTYYNKTRGKKWRGKPHQFPRHIVNKCEATHISMNNHFCDAWNLNKYDRFTYNRFSTSKLIISYAAKCVGRNWNRVQSEIYHKLIKYNLSSKEIFNSVDEDLFGIYRNSWFWKSRKNEYPYEIVNGKLERNPDYKLKSNHRNYPYTIRKDYIRYNKKQLNNIDPIEITPNLEFKKVSHDIKFLPKYYYLCNLWIHINGSYKNIPIYHDSDDWYWGLHGRDNFDHDNFTRLRFDQFGLKYIVSVNNYVVDKEEKFDLRSSNNRWICDGLFFINGEQQFKEKYRNISYGELHLCTRNEYITKNVGR